MNSSRPVSLIQIHYHDRLGGVNKVIGLYAAAFEKMNGASKSHANIVVCNTGLKDGKRFSPAKTQSMPLCEYREFFSKLLFVKTKEVLTGSFENLINNPLIPRPVCVIGHNLTLGKNCALSAAFAQCARNHAALGDGVTFLSIIHDFAEEGRIDCIQRIARIRKMGIAIENELYPALKNVRFCTPSRGNARLLKKAGLNAQWMVNPIEIPESATMRISPLKKKTIQSRLALLAKKDGTVFDSALPILLYPGRCISRKNILETLLLSRFIYKANILVGAPGSSPGDARLFSKAKETAEKFKLPVVFDCGRAQKEIDSGSLFSAELFSIADWCVSTSIAEGFGYAFYEPWLFGKAVIGRKPIGFAYGGGLKTPRLYERIPIPASWVCLPELAEKYHTSMRACFGHMKEVSDFFDKSRFYREWTAYFVKDGTVDFGCLDASTQIALIVSMIQSPVKVAQWEKVCGKEIAVLRALFKKNTAFNKARISFNGNRIKKNCSMDAFFKTFEKCLSVKNPKAKPRNDYQLLAREFCSFSRFRLLMTAENLNEASSQS